MTAAASTTAPHPTATGAGPRVRVFVSDHDSEATIRQCLGDIAIEDVAFTSGDVRTAAVMLAKQPSPRLLIVDVSGADDPAESVRELSEVLEPEARVIAIGSGNDIVLYRQLKHAGVTEYFFKPLVRHQLARACHDILTDQADQTPGYAGNVVFVLGVRGGVGATTLATNTAWYLAETGLRWTVMLDLDVHNGDAALQFDAAPGRALREALEHPERVDKLFLERGVTRVIERLNLLASLEALDDTVEGSEEAVTALIENLLRRYRAVVVDMPAIIASALPQVLNMPSTCVLVANSTLTAARDLGRWKKQIGPNTRERRTLSVLNHTTPHGGLPEAEFARAAGQPPDIVIPYDRELADASNFGTRAMQKCSTYRNGVLQMLHSVTGEPVKKQVSMLKRIFSR